MKTKLRTALVMLIAVVALGWAGTQTASAAKRFGMTEVQNSTNHQLIYFIKWGNNGAWQKQILNPGINLIHWSQYQPGSASSPALYIRFDDDFQHPSNPLRGYMLLRYAGPEVNSVYTKKYKFQYDGQSGRYIDLVSIN